MPLTLRIEKLTKAVSSFLGILTAVLFVLMLFTVFINVVKRYVLNDVSIGMQELEWHFFSTMFLLGIPFALSKGGHVRVDLIYENLSSIKKAWIDLIGTLLFLFPFSLLILYFGVGFAQEAFLLGETSGDPGGLPYRWIIKSMISISFGFTIVAGVELLLTSINTLRGYHDHPHFESHQ